MMDEGTPVSSVDGSVAAKGLEAVDRFLETFNGRDARVWADSLNYPHVRPAAEGAARAGNVFAKTAEEYAEGVDYDRILQTGWERSEWDSKEVIHARGDKAHVAGQYSRFDAGGKKILTVQVTYAVTELEGKWGVQARFPAGLATASGAAVAKSEAAARQAVDDFMAAWNARDEKAWAATLNYPHVRVASGGVRIWDTAEEYADGFDFEAFVERTGWHHSKWGSVRVVQSGESAANVALQFDRFDEQDTKISGYDAVYLVTHQDGHWGVRARSSFAP